MVYLNVSTAIDCVAAFAAKKMRVIERVIHSHSSGNSCENAVQRTVYNIIHRVCKLFLYRLGTQFYGCSVKAGKWLFPKKIVNSKQFDVIYNAVDRDCFQYDDVRKEVRKELKIDNDNLFVIGHIGGFLYYKNHPFLIDVFEQIHRLKNESILLLAGTGYKMEKIKGLVRQKQLEDCVYFLGWRTDADRLYQAMDLFLLPSKFEVFPIVGVEAQCTQLACVFSDSITMETKMQDHCYYLSLAESPHKWADFILQHQNYERSYIQLTEEAKYYDLKNQKDQLRRIVWH